MRPRGAQVRVRLRGSRVFGTAARAAECQLQLGPLQRVGEEEDGEQRNDWDAAEQQLKRGQRWGTARICARCSALEGVS